MPLTAQEKATLQGLVGALSGAVNALTVDGPVTPTPPVGEVWTDYQSAFLGSRAYRSVVTDAAGKPVTPAVEGTDYTSEAVDSAHGLVFWGDAVEHHSIVVGPDGLERWGAVAGYGSVASPAIFYPEEVTRCDWTNQDTGGVRDLSAFTVGPVGGIMCPYNLPAGGRYRLRQWGYIWNARAADGGVRDHPFYWQVDYVFGTIIANQAWAKDAQTTRPAIRFSEAWWAVDVWTRASSTVAPWLGSGAAATINPAFDGSTVVYDGWDAFGKGAGTLWQYRSAAFNVALTTTSP